MLVDLVSVQTQDGVRLDGTFRKPAQEPASQLGVDVVILHHGVGGNFYHPGMFDAFSDALLDMGCAVLRVNNRGHDLVSRVMVSQIGHEPEAKRLAPLMRTWMRAGTIGPLGSTLPTRRGTSALVYGASPVKVKWPIERHDRVLSPKSDLYGTGF